MDSLYFSRALDYVWEKVQAINKEIDEKKPWELNKVPEKHDELVAILTGLAEELLQVAELLKPFLPDTAEQIIAVFDGSAADGKIVPPAAPLFPKN